MNVSPVKGKIAVVSNPVSGGGLGSTKLRELLGILRAKNLKFETFVSTQPGDCIKFGEQIKKTDFDCLLVLGGDGTISEVAKGLIGSPIPVAAIPCGSGNDIAGTLGIPRELDKAVEILFDPGFVQMDLFKDQETVYVETIGCGFVADVVSSVVRLSKILHGSIAYFAGVLETMSKFRASKYKITVDDWNWEGMASLVIINNTWRVGGGMKLTPEAVIDDGLLDIAIFTSTSRLTLMKMLPKVYSGSHVKSPHIKILKGKKFSVQAEKELIKTADGDIIGTLPIEVEILPGAMKFFCRKR